MLPLFRAAVELCSTNRLYNATAYTEGKLYADQEIVEHKRMKFCTKSRA